MRIIKAVIATTHLDKQRECLTVEALQSLVEQVNSQYIPIDIEHDPRIPPQGRFISAEIIKMEDGEYGVEGTGQLFENGDEGVLDGDVNREIPLSSFALGEYEIHYDRGLLDSKSQKIINEIAKTLTGRTQELVKKSLDPISVLLIGVGFILGGIAGGFLNKLGSDAFDYLKAKLKELFASKRNEKGEHLLSFEFTVIKESYSLNVEVIMSNPTDEIIDSFFDVALFELDKLLHQYYNTSVGLKKIVIVYEEKQLKIKFGIRKDAVTLYPK